MLGDCKKKKMIVLQIDFKLIYSQSHCSVTMTIKLFFVILLLFGAVHVKSAFGESGLDLEGKVPLPLPRRNVKYSTLFFATLASN